MSHNYLIIAIIAAFLSRSNLDLDLPLPQNEERPFYSRYGEKKRVLVNTLKLWSKIDIVVLSSARGRKHPAFLDTSNTSLTLPAFSPVE
uniref:Hypothetical secreted peptide n=1 Tax=Glossina morsitans morsitans TaxID=37546 RepID=D3TSJ3_GLOMM